MGVARVLIAHRDGLGTAGTAVGQVVDALFDVVVAQDAVDFGYVQGAVAYGDPVRQVEFFGDGKDLVGLVVAVGIAQGVDAALLIGPHEERAFGTQAHRPRGSHALGVEGDFEAGG